MIYINEQQVLKHILKNWNVCKLILQQRPWDVQLELGYLKWALEGDQDICVHCAYPLKLMQPEKNYRS